MHSQRSVVAARPYAPLDIATQVEASASRSCCPGIAAWIPICELSCSDTEACTCHPL